MCFVLINSVLLNILCIESIFTYVILDLSYNYQDKIFHQVTTIIQKQALHPPLPPPPRPKETFTIAYIYIISPHLYLLHAGSHTRA